MAGDWIKMRADLADDPAVIEMAACLDMDEFSVVGRLHSLWSWADSQSRDGHARGVTAMWINRKLQRDGFAEAMVSVHWLEINEDGIAFPNFENHNGATAKTRALGTNRKQKERASSVGHDQVTPSSRTERDKSETREEKRREEIEEEKKPRASRSATTLEGVSPELLADYLKVRVAKRAGPLTETAANGLRREATKASLSLEQAVTACVEFGWQGFNAGWYADRTAGKPSPNVTVPSAPGRDPALQKLDDDAKRAVPPSLETLARMAELRRAGAH